MKKMNWSEMGTCPDFELRKRTGVHVRLTELFISHVEHGQQVGIRHPSFQNNELLGTVREVGYSSEGISSFPVTILLTGTGKQIPSRQHSGCDLRF